ncbi:LysR family transcriptional regulator [Pseudohalioglobus sediminis]|uniref:LysR family transcriptional regulator n=1 Tax=Pseudohalioglobus sediminis TaxID=2606449 RepID=A0A5B0X4T8_9GAMM|nr:LysR family transcriptional regulator [Pseudohalioglobus sediminis]KAA1194316.1 LysR family transcriptional regulator [Pseudohalioglobus sediminis]
MNKTTLEQWRMLQAVVRHGGFAQAAAAIHKSQSTINHAVHKLEDLLGLPLLEVVGRKAQLTEAGELMLRRAEQLLDQAGKLEEIAASLACGTEAEIRIAVDAIYPNRFLADALQALSHAYPHTRVQLLETVLSGGNERLLAGEVDLLVTGDVPGGFVGEPMMRAEFIAVAHPEHPLHQLGRAPALADLQQQRQIVVRDSAQDSSTDSGWLGAEQRWTVSHVATSIEMIERGMGFAWLPALRISDALAAGRLQPLALEQGSARYTEVYLVYADRDRAGPATLHLGELLLQACR